MPPCNGDCQQGRTCNCECNCKCKMTDRDEFEKFLKDNFLYDTSGFIQNEAERKKAQDESFVWRAWQARGEIDAVQIQERDIRIEELLKCLKIQADKIESLKKAIEIKPLSEILGEDE